MFGTHIRQRTTHIASIALRTSPRKHITNSSSGGLTIHVARLQEADRTCSALQCQARKTLAPCFGSSVAINLSIGLMLFHDIS